MTHEEIRWLEICKANPEKYLISVDNDDVFVTDADDDVLFTFNHFGWELVIDLLRYIGCNAESV